jgi:5-methylcytosine-specific restriction endonuclease McrA
MKNHTKVYFKAFGYDTNSWIGCEVCGSTAVDIHHIESRGMGGSKNADTIENLMALCRECHVEFGDKKHYKELLVATHAMRMSNL